MNSPKNSKGFLRQGFQHCLLHHPYIQDGLCCLAGWTTIWIVQQKSRGYRYYPAQQLVTRRFPPGTAVGHVLFNALIEDTVREQEFVKSTDGTKLGESADTTQMRSAIQKDLNCLVGWPNQTWKNLKCYTKDGRILSWRITVWGPASLERRELMDKKMETSRLATGPRTQQGVPALFRAVLMFVNQLWQQLLLSTENFLDHIWNIVFSLWECPQTVQEGSIKQPIKSIGITIKRGSNYCNKNLYILD